MAAPNPKQNPGEIIDVDERRLMAALSYIGILVLVPLLMKKDDEFIRFHAKQGLVILIGTAIALTGAAWSPVGANILFLVLLVLDVLGLVQALLGKKWRIPVIANIADNFKI